jgi:protocatechuate 3,4-dioxygenase beta subunit
MNLDDEVHDHDRALGHDLTVLMQRRTALRLIGGLGVVALAACADKASTGAGTTTSTTAGAAASGSGSTTTTAGASTTTAATGTATDPIPEETAGPYPGDGSNGPNVLTEDGIVRTDIRPSFGSSSGVADGVVSRVTFTVADAATGAAKSGAAVYVWHCDREGRYSLYSQGATDENYLRGVAVTDANGDVTFTTIFPACYAGRWPHIHFEVYDSLDQATSAGTPVATSQIALPEHACALVYATDGYGQSVTNVSQVSLATDNVFADGWTTELGTVTGDVNSGMAISLAVPV